MPGRTAARTWGLQCRLALAVAMALGLSACGGGGGGGGNVKPSSPSTPPVGPTGYAGGEINVDANATRAVTDNLGGSVGVIKEGAGTLTFSGTNSYTGTTQVNGGSLYVNGDQTAATAMTTVANGATLGGAGIVGGSVTLASGGALAPGDVGAIGTLTINGNLTLASGSVLNYDIGAVDGSNQPSDLINVKGNLTLAGVLNIHSTTGGDLGPGIHRLINYSGSLVDNGLALGSMPSTGWLIQTSVANQINLIDARNLTFGFWDGDAGPKGNNAVDGGSGTWQVGGNSNWTDANGGINLPYDEHAFAVFEGAPGTVTVDTTNGAVNATSMQFASDGYVVQGGGIHLVGSDADATEAYIRVGDGTSAGASFKATINSALSGDVMLHKTDAGWLTLGAVNSYTGGTLVAGGTLEITAGATPGPGLVTVGNQNGPSDPPPPVFQVDHGATLSNLVSLQGNGVLNNAGTLDSHAYITVSDDGVPGNTGLSPVVNNHDGGIIRGTHAALNFSISNATVNNRSGGLIEGGDAAIYLGSGTTVNNDGTASIIRSTGGVAIDGHGDITNTGGATISGSIGAINLHGPVVSVTNRDTGSLISSVNGYGINADDTASVQNLNGATISSGKTAVYLGNGGTLVNGAGSVIQTTGTGTGDCATSNACAIYVHGSSPYGAPLSGAADITNAGTIIGDVQLFSPATNHLTLMPGGVIQGNLTIGSSTFTNLILDGSAGSVARYSQAVTGHTDFSGGIATVASAGTWIADNDQLAPGLVQINPGSTLRIGDGGTHGSVGTSLIANHGTVVFDRSDDVTFTGGIVGTLGAPSNDWLVKAGSGKLAVSIGGFAPSNLLIQDGAFQIDTTGNKPAATSGYLPLYINIENNSSLIFYSYENVAAPLAITGTGSLAQNGSGVLFLDGQNTYTGGTSVNNGLLRTSFILPGNASVGAAGTLDGNSPDTPPLGLPGVGGNLANAGKVAVHGRDATIGGDYTQAATGTLAISLGSKLAVAGHATLSGGTLEITGADDGYVSNTHTPVLTAQDGLTGTFGQLTKDAGVVFTATTINYDAHSAWLDTTGLDVTQAAAGHGVAYTPTSFNSAQRVQGAFTQLNSKIASGDTSGVSSDFVKAAGQFQQAPTLQAAQASLQSLSGQLHAASAAMTFETIDASSRALADHFDNVLGKSQDAGMWTSNLSMGGGMGRTGYDGVGFQLNGWLVGSDRQIGSSGVAGFAFGQSKGQQQLDQSFDHNRSRSTEAMLYAGWLNGNWYTQGRVGFGYFDQDVSRQLLLGNSAQGVSTNYSGNYNVAYGESGLHLNWGGSRIMPFVNVQYASIARDGFSEQGAGGFGLRTNAQAIDRWQGGMGLRATRQWRFAGGQTLDFSASAQFRRTFASHGDAFDASFAGLQQYQPLIGVGLSRYSGVLNLGVDAALSSRTSLKFGYDYEKGQRDESQVVSARLLMAL